MEIASPAILPTSLNLKKLSFWSRWYGAFANVYEARDPSTRTFCFGYWYPNSDTDQSRVVCIIEEHARFSLEPRSAIWRVAEIDLERQNDWLVFSRPQEDLSSEALKGFLTDSKNLLEHLRSAGKHLDSVSN